uniref:WhiB family transcriptional regulator n=1 Tax=Nocardia farcinica TaxID=37329 RepID=UPI00245516F5
MTVRTLPSAAQRALTELLPLSDARGWHRAACRGDPNHDAWFPYPSEDFDYGRAHSAGGPLRGGGGGLGAAPRPSGGGGGGGLDS